MSAFTTSGTTTGAALIQEQYEADVVDAIFYNGFQGMTLPDGRELWPKKRAVGGNNCNWLVRRGANTSTEVFVEGDAQPGADSQHYSAPAVPWTYVRAMAQITGHAIDAMGSNRVGIDVVDSEILGAADDINDLMATSFLGSTYGLELAVDSTSTFGGIARGSATWWESLETAVNDALSGTDLEDMIESLRDNDRGSDVQAFLMPWNQVTRYGRIASTPYVASGPPNDKGAHLSGQTFSGIPILGIGDMTDTVIMGLDIGTTRKPKFQIKSVRPMQVKEMAPSGDSDVMQISSGAAFVCFDPLRQGKLTGCTA